MREKENIVFHNISAEAGILSAVLFENDIFDYIQEKLSVNDFYLPAHKECFSIMANLRESGKPIDEVFLLEGLKKTRNYTEDVLLKVMSANPISQIDSYIQMLKDLTQKRMLYQLSIDIRKNISDDLAAQDVLIRTLDSLEEVQNSTSESHKDRKMSEITEEIRIDMDRAQSGEKLPYFETGYPSFDSRIGGFVENGLTVVAGRPSMGKSSFTSGPIVKTLEDGDSAVFYSMEVADKNALIRLVSFKSQEPLSSIKKGMVNDFKGFDGAMKFFEDNDNRFNIVDRSGMTRRELEIDIVKRIKSNNRLKLIIVDHLLQIQLDSNKHAPTELGEITKMLKRVSQNYKVTVVLLSQLNRSVESRENKRPMMADLQGSGSIEQDADMIVFLYRQEYYREREWDQEKDGPYQKKNIEQAEAIIGKNRDGPTGSVELGFKAVTASFLPDYTPSAIVEYIDDGPQFNNTNFNENVGSQAPIKENNDIVDADIEAPANVSIPLL